MMDKKRNTAHFHLPGLFEFYELYRLFLTLYKERREYFYDWCDIGSIYGAPSDCIWGGGRTSMGTADAEDVLKLMKESGISSRLTFSNSLLLEKHLDDSRCNHLCEIFSKTKEVKNGIIVHSNLLKKYLKEKYPNLYLVSSTTKVLLPFEEFEKELEDDDFEYVVMDFRLNRSLKQLEKLSDKKKEKTEFLINECCSFSCRDRKECYENVSRKNLMEDCDEFMCTSPELKEGYRFSLAMKNPSFISVSDILCTYLPLGFTNFKIEGRGLGSALVLEFLLYYMVKPEYQIHVREYIYLDNMLDLF